jgi:hypothetical protein
MSTDRKPQAACFHRASPWSPLGQALLLVLLAALAPAASAGRPCEEQPLQTLDLERGMQLAQNVQRRLDDSGAQVVVIARAGQDLSAYGLRWSHLGLAYREGDGEYKAARQAEPAVPRGDLSNPAKPDLPKSPWRIVHKLNHCNTPNAAVYRQGLGPFFLDRPFRYEAAYLVLGAPAQAALLTVLRDNAASARLHEPRYNMLAYPWAQKYQQSNQWAIETLASALEPDARTRGQAQAWLQLRGYEPTVLHIGPLTRLGATVSRANVAFDDHPNGKRFADRIETVTVDSVFEWLARSGLAEGGLQRVSL